MTGDDGKGAPGKGGLTGTTVRGLFWMLSGTGAQAITKIVVLAVLARLISKEDFGLVAKTQRPVGDAFQAVDTGTKFNRAPCQFSDLLRFIPLHQGDMISDTLLKADFDGKRFAGTMCGIP